MNPNPERDERDERVSDDQIRCSCGQLVSKSAIDAVLAKRKSSTGTDNESVRQNFHECPMCCYDCDCTQGNAGGLCLHCNDPLSAETDTEDVSTIANVAATRMRDACVAKLMKLRETYRAGARTADAEERNRDQLIFLHKANAMTDAVNEIQSLTLEQGEQEKR